MNSVLLYVARRALLHFVPVLVGMSMLVFGVIRLVPGDAADLMNVRMTLEQRAETRRLFGLEEPIPVQYAIWLGEVVQGNLGVSLRSGRAVVDEIAAVLPGTLELGLLGALLGIGIGLPVGILSAVHQDRPADRGMRFLVYIFISLPEFWLGTLMVLLFSIHLRWLPAGGYVGLFDDPLEALRFVVMPAVVLGLIMAAFLSRVVRSTMLETLRQDYVTVARAKGLSGPAVLLDHALRNAAGPIITLVGLQFAFLISGSVIVEEVFVRPGLGRLLVRSIFQRDYAVVQGVTLLFTVIFVAANLLTDVLRGIVDPRVRARA